MKKKKREGKEKREGRGGERKKKKRGERKKRGKRRREKRSSAREKKREVSCCLQHAWVRRLRLQPLRAASSTTLLFFFARASRPAPNIENLGAKDAP